MLHHRELTKCITGLAIEVHRHTGSGVLEAFYAAALCRELARAGIRVRREVVISSIYKGEPLPLGFRADILADETVILEIKSVPVLFSAHDMQLQTHPRMSGLPAGLLLNFHAPRLKEDLQRFAGCRSIQLRGPQWPSRVLRAKKIPGLTTHCTGEW